VAFSAAGGVGGALGAERVLAEVREAIEAAESPRLVDGVSWLIESRPARASEVVCHGDLHPGNLLARGGQLVALLDWELATLAEPEFDVARTFVLLRSAPGGDSRFGRWLRQRLGRLGARGFLSAYASADPRRLRWYEALHCLRIIALAVEARVGSERQSARVTTLWDPLVDVLAERFRRLTGIALRPTGARRN
jgi:aminoglycoside phosphotransferase (APT) family kinase protein